MRAGSFHGNAVSFRGKFAHSFSAQIDSNPVTCSEIRPTKSYGELEDGAKRVIEVLRRREIFVEIAAV